MFSEVAKYNI